MQTNQQTSQHTGPNGNTFFYRTNDDGTFLCSWDESFEDTWTVDNLESTDVMASGGCE